MRRRAAANARGGGARRVGCGVWGDRGDRGANEIHSRSTNAFQIHKCIPDPQMSKVLKAMLTLTADRFGRSHVVHVSEAEQAAIDTLTSQMEHFLCICVALGSRKAGLAHKFHAVVHQCYMMTGRPLVLRELLFCIASWTVDLGVESGLNNVEPIAFETLFPYFVDHNEDMADEEWSAEMDLGGSLMLAGGMHVSSNMMKGLLGSLPSWTEEIGEQATALASFLHHPWTRERFVITCLTGDLERYAFLFKSFPSSLSRWRWGDVVEVLQKLVDLEIPLHRAWNHEAIQGEVDRGQQENKIKQGVDVRQCTDAVSSTWFWNYIAMVSVLSIIGNHIYSWFQACPCHKGDDVQKRLKTTLGGSWPSCPLAGRVLPQLAVGELERFADELFRTSHLEVLSVVDGLSVAQITKLLQDFDLGRQHMLVHIRLKGAYHQDLPLLLSGLCHPDQMRARGAARRAIGIWRSWPAERQATAHVLTRRFMLDHIDSLVAFENQALDIQDAPVEMLTDLARLGLGRLDEHQAEGPHAVMKRELHHAPNAGASYLSLAQRLPLWHAMLQKDEKKLEMQAEQMNLLYNAHSASRLLGVSTHPDMQTVFAF